MIAKIIVPDIPATELEYQEPWTKKRSQRRTGLTRLAMGAGDGMSLALNVMAMLIAFAALIALANLLLSLLGEVGGETLTL